MDETGQSLLEAVPNMTVSEDLHTVALCIAIAVFLGVVVRAVLLGRRFRTPLPLIMLISGGLAFGWEPIVDTLGKCWLPEDHQVTLFTAFGRDMPLYGLFVYMAFFGGFSMMTWAYLKNGGSPSRLWRVYATAIFVNIFLFESPAVWADIYTYYGDQPLDFWGFPLWWPFVNTAGPIAAGAVAYVLDEHAKVDRRALFAFALIAEPLFDGLSNGIAAGPTWWALNADVSTPIVWAAGLLTCALGCAVVRTTIQGLTLVVGREDRRALVGRRLAVEPATASLS